MEARTVPIHRPLPEPGPELFKGPTENVDMLRIVMRGLSDNTRAHVLHDLRRAMRKSSFHKGDYAFMHDAITAAQDVAWERRQPSL